MLVTELASGTSYYSAPDSIGLIYHDADEAAVVALVRRLVLESNPFKGRVVLINRDLRTVRSRMSDRSWNDIIPHEHALRRTRLHRRVDPQSRHAEGRGPEVSDAGCCSPVRPAMGNRQQSNVSSTRSRARPASSSSRRSSTFARSDHLAQALAPSVVILEDLDLMTKSRQNPYSTRAGRMTSRANCCRCYRAARLTRT